MNKTSAWNFKIIKFAIFDSLLKLNFRYQLHNPIMFTVYVGSILTSALFIKAILSESEAPVLFILNITLWLWFTVIFANFAESMAEGRGKAQAQALRKSRREVQAKKLSHATRNAKITLIPSAHLQIDDIVLVEAG